MHREANLEMEKHLEQVELLARANINSSLKASQGHSSNITGSNNNSRVSVGRKENTLRNKLIGKKARSVASKRSDDSLNKHPFTLNIHESLQREEKESKKDDEEHTSLDLNIPSNQLSCKDEKK